MYRDEERRFNITFGTIVAFVAAAVMPAVVVGVFMFVIVFAYAFVVALGHLLVLGLPAFLLGLRFKAIRWWSTLVVAFIVGAAPAAIDLWPDHSRMGWAHYVDSFTDWGLLGVSGGTAFWLLWRYWVRLDSSHGS